MSDRLLPPAELAPSTDRNLTPGEWIEAWFEVLQIGEAFLLAGLARDLAPGESLEDRVRRWSREAYAEHDRRVDHLLKELARRDNLIEPPPTSIYSFT